MTTRLLVDAMNVVGSRPDGWWRDVDGAVRRLADRLDRYATATGTPVTLVVDGYPRAQLPEGTHGAIEILYARRTGPDGADDRLVESLDALAGRADGEPTVVTADRELRERVSARGAGLLGPSELLRRLDVVDDAAGDAGGSAATPRRAHRRC